MKKKKLLALAMVAVLAVQPTTYAGATIEQNNGNVEESENQDLGENSTMNSEEKNTLENKHSEVQNHDQEQQQDQEDGSGNSEGDSGEESPQSQTSSDETQDSSEQSQDDTQQNPDDSQSESNTTSETGSQGVTTHPMTGGYIPSDLDYNTPVYEPLFETYADDKLESKYPANGVDDIKAKYPSIRDQNPYGTCWAFASMGLAEFDLINDGTFDKTIDLSELQLSYFIYNSVVDPLGGTRGDYSKYYVENSGIQYGYLGRGGNYSMASRRLNQWVGAVNEADVPYSNAANVLTQGIADEYAYSHDVAHIENTYMINIKSNPEEVKRQIKEHGAAGIMYYHSDTGYQYITNSYCDTSEMSGGGHAVMAVGWDDNYSKDNFREGVKPSTDGAWLIRNSWGESNGYRNQCEYFWMSYETYSLADTAWVFDFSKDDGYDNNYQVDGGLDLGTYRYSKAIPWANIFTTQKKDGISSEDLKAVSISFTSKTNVEYKIEIYTDLKTEGNPYSGTRQESATTEGVTGYAGVYTIELGQPVKLKPGTTYAVVVTADVMDYERVSMIEENNGKKVWDVAVSSTDPKSYYCLSNYYWREDQYGYNYCIKAFTSNNTSEENPDVKLAGKSLTMNGSIDVNFYMDLSETIANDPDTYMEFKMENGRTSKVQMNQATKRTIDGKLYYGFSCPVYAKEMADQVTAQFYVDGKPGETYTYSIKQYAQNVLDGKVTCNQETLNVVKAMLNYGAAAQVQFNYKTDTLANASLSDTDKVITDGSFDTYKKSISTDEGINGIGFYGSSLILTSDTTVRHYFQLTSGYDVANYTFTYTNSEGSTVTLEPQKWPDTEDMYYVEITGIKAQKLNQCPTVTVHDKNGNDGNGIQVTYGPFSYAYNVSNNSATEAKLKNVVNSLYWYWYCADAYVQSQAAI